MYHLFHPHNISYDHHHAGGFTILFLCLLFSHYHLNKYTEKKKLRNCFNHISVTVANDIQACHKILRTYASKLNVL